MNRKSGRVAFLGNMCYKGAEIDTETGRTSVQPIYQSSYEVFSDAALEAHAAAAIAAWDAEEAAETSSDH